MFGIDVVCYEVRAAGSEVYTPLSCLLCSSSSSSSSSFPGPLLIPVRSVTNVVESSGFWIQGTGPLSTHVRSVSNGVG